MSDVLDIEGRTIRTEKAFNVSLTSTEMQYVANGIAAFMNVMHREKTQINPLQISSLIQTLEKFKLAMNTANNYKIVQVVS